MVYDYRIGACTALLACSSSLFAEDARVIEEIIVMAQRVEENLQKVPIAASAFTDTMIDDRQIIGLADLQLRVPNMNFADQAVGRGRFNIRGIGRQNDQSGGEAGVAVHINSIPVPGETRFELFDIERLEVLRGPQGTLYGRNATGGTVNMITKKPSPETVDGYLELEYGDYDHRFVEGALNVPLGRQLAVRVAGLSLQRDGFTKNLAARDLEGVSDDMDGRDIWSARVTAEWWVTDALTLTAFYNHFDEDDDRLRSHGIICKQNPLPTLGCVPGEVGFEPLHPHANAGWWALLIGGRPVGARDASTGLNFDVPRPEVDFRRQHTDFNPIFKRNEDFVGGTLDWVGERYAFTLSGGYYDQRFFSAQDHEMDVGYTFDPTPAVPSGLWPISAVPSGIAKDRTSSQCNLNDGTAGLRGGCVWADDLTRHFAYQPTTTEMDQVTTEAMLHTTWDGPVDFLVGGNYLTRDYATETRFFDNYQDQGAGALGATPGYGGILLTEEYDTYSAFAEMYWQLTDAWKITVGLRYNHDEKSTNSAGMGDLQGFRVGGTADQPEFIRSNLFGWWVSGIPQPRELAITDFYGATEAIESATTFEERLAAFQRVSIAEGLNETLLIAGFPPKRTWEGVSGRFEVAWTATPNNMVYASYARGYKPGGFQKTGPAFDEETVDAVEVGAKNRLLDGTMILNAALFWNNHTNMLLDEGPAGVNLDARSLGAELEVEWRPTFLPNLQISVAYGWLDSELDDGQLVFDHYDPLQGNPDYILLKDNPLPILFVAPRAQVLPLVDQAIAAGAAVGQPGTLYADGTPSLISAQFLVANGVETSNGFKADVGGNKIPFAPTHTFSIGLGYSWYFGFGSAHARWDYYRQSRSFSRIYNVPGRAIPSWKQHDVSLAFESANGRWMVKAWARNLTDEISINNNSFAFAQSGGARFFNLNDPRLFGATVRMNFGSE